MFGPLEDPRQTATDRDRVMAHVDENYEQCNNCEHINKLPDKRDQPVLVRDGEPFFPDALVAIRCKNCGVQIRLEQPRKMTDDL